MKNYHDLFICRVSPRIELHEKTFFHNQCKQIMYSADILDESLINCGLQIVNK